MKVVWGAGSRQRLFQLGTDNLALHQIGQAELAQYQPPRGQLLDHFGVILESPAQVDEMFTEVQHEGAWYGSATIAKPPKQHRDGSYSFISPPIRTAT